MGGPILGVLYFSMKDGTLLDKNFFWFCGRNEKIEFLCWFNTFHFCKNLQKTDFLDPFTRKKSDFKFFLIKISIKFRKIYKGV